jgi:hypothetical protein
VTCPVASRLSLHPRLSRTLLPVAGNESLIRFSAAFSPAGFAQKSRIFFPFSCFLKMDFPYFCSPFWGKTRRQGIKRQRPVQNIFLLSSVG